MEVSGIVERIWNVEAGRCGLKSLIFPGLQDYGIHLHQKVRYETTMQELQESVQNQSLIPSAIRSIKGLDRNWKKIFV